jgi:hypothetical protein
MKASLTIIPKRVKLKSNRLSDKLKKGNQYSYIKIYKRKQLQKRIWFCSELWKFLGAQFGEPAGSDWTGRAVRRRPLGSLRKFSGVAGPWGHLGVFGLVG